MVIFVQLKGAAEACIRKGPVVKLVVGNKEDPSLVAVSFHERDYAPVETSIVPPGVNFFHRIILTTHAPSFFLAIRKGGHFERKI